MESASMLPKPEGTGASYAEKLLRSLHLLLDAHTQYGDGLVVGLTPAVDSCVVWDLARRVHPKVRGFIVALPGQPPEASEMMDAWIEREPAIRLFDCAGSASDAPSELQAYWQQRTVDAIMEMGARCWVTAGRRRDGQDRFALNDIERIDRDRVCLHPILAWSPLDIRRYLQGRWDGLLPFPSEAERLLQESVSAVA